MERGLAERIEEIAEKAAAESGVEFVRSEIAGAKRNMTVRVFIDKEGGVSIDDCTAVSQSMEAVLDSDDFIPSAYVLEVSSPGIERGLFRLDDYRRFAGKKAKIKAEAGIEGQTNFTGRIVDVRRRRSNISTIRRAVPFASRFPISKRQICGSILRRNSKDVRSKRVGKIGMGQKAALILGYGITDRTKY